MAPSNLFYPTSKTKSDSYPQLPYMLQHEPFFFLLLLLLSTEVIILAQVFTLAAPSAYNVLVAPSQSLNLCSDVSSLESHPMKINPLQSFSNSHSALFPSEYDCQLNLFFKKLTSILLFAFPICCCISVV